jgi:hypothetical protein
VQLQNAVCTLFSRHVFFCRKTNPKCTKKKTVLKKKLCKKKNSAQFRNLCRLQAFGATIYEVYPVVKMARILTKKGDVCFCENKIGVFVQ